MRISKPNYRLSELTGVDQADVIDFEPVDLKAIQEAGASRWPAGLELDHALRRITESPFSMTAMILIEHADSAKEEAHWILLKGCSGEFDGCNLMYASPDVISGVSAACILATTTYGWQLIRELLEN
jgi:hypothetical protein